MRARDRDARQYEGARCAAERNMAGIGDRLDPAPVDLEDAIAGAGRIHGEKAARMLLRFAELPDGTLIWTQTGDDEFRLGRLHGSWRYVSSGCFEASGIHHLRPADWMPGALTVEQTPPGVTDAFARGGRNLQRINDREAERASAELWESRMSRR